MPPPIEPNPYQPPSASDQPIPSRNAIIDRVKTMLGVLLSAGLAGFGTFLIACWSLGLMTVGNLSHSWFAFDDPFLCFVLASALGLLVTLGTAFALIHRLRKRDQGKT